MTLATNISKTLMEVTGEPSVEMAISPVPKAWRRLLVMPVYLAKVYNKGVKNEDDNNEKPYYNRIIS